MNNTSPKIKKTFVDTDGKGKTAIYTLVKEGEIDGQPLWNVELSFDQKVSTAARMKYISPSAWPRTNDFRYV